MSTREGPQKAAAARQDPRFAAVGTDPRFQRFPKKQKRVEIDERFAGESACVNACKAAVGMKVCRLQCRAMLMCMP